MQEPGLIKQLARLELLLQKLVLILAAGFLVAMMLLTCANILLRLPPFQWPVPGVYELMGYFGALVVAGALAYTQRRKDHIAVDVLTSLYPPALRRVLEAINRLACMAFSVVAAWQVGRVAATLRASGEVSETLRVVYYPFTYGVAAGFWLLALVFLIEMLKALFAPPQAEPGPAEEEPV